MDNTRHGCGVSQTDMRTQNHCHFLRLVKRTTSFDRTKKARFTRAFFYFMLLELLALPRCFTGWFGECFPRWFAGTTLAKATETTWALGVIAAARSASAWT